MARKYHIRKDGTPGICTAMHSCPLGRPLDDHFNTAKEASAAYEKEMMAEMLPEGETKKLSARDLQKLAKITTDEKLQMEIAENGSDLAKRNLAKNPEATTEVIEKAYIKADKDETRIALAKHLNADYRIMNPEHVGIALAKHYADSSKDSSAKVKPILNKINQELESSHIGDYTVKAFLHNAEIQKGYSAYLPKSSIKSRLNQLTNKAFANTNNLMSNEYRKSRAEDVPSLKNQLIAQGDVYTLEEFQKISENEPFLYNTKNKKYIKHFVNEAVNENNTREKRMRLAEEVVNSDNAISSDLTRLYESKLPINEKKLYDHPKASSELRRKMRENSKEIQSNEKLKKLSKGNLSLLRSSLMTEIDNKSTETGWNELYIKLDKKKINELGLEPYDVDNLFHSDGSFSNLYKYNPKTGVFGGAYDSSD